MNTLIQSPPTYSSPAGLLACAGDASTNVLAIPAAATPIPVMVRSERITFLSSVRFGLLAVYTHSTYRRSRRFNPLAFPLFSISRPDRVRDHVQLRITNVVANAFFAGRADGEAF